MARETLSEGLISTANNFYRKNKIAIIRKNEPMTRMINGRLIFSSSMGLDFTGYLKGGHHISFEVKETEKTFLPPQNIRGSQLIAMNNEEEMSIESFLVVLFKPLKEWYRIEARELIHVMKMDLSKIPVEYFQAFGKIIPTDNGWPDYLNPELHPMSNNLKKNMPEWISPKRRERKIKPIDKPKQSRRERIMDAMARGIKNAEKKQNRSYGTNYEPKR